MYKLQDGSHFFGFGSTFRAAFATKER
jgi:hypothetical protein